MARGDEFRIGGQGERKKQLEDRVFLIAGVDPDDRRNAYFLPVGPNGLKVDATITASSAGEQLPPYDDSRVTTKDDNGPLTVEYRRNNVLVATRTIVYDGDGDFSRSYITLP